MTARPGPGAALLALHHILLLLGRGRSRNDDHCAAASLAGFPLGTFSALSAGFPRISLGTFIALGSGGTLRSSIALRSHGPLVSGCPLFARRSLRAGGALDWRRCCRNIDHGTWPVAGTQTQHCDKRCK